VIVSQSFPKGFNRSETHQPVNFFFEHFWVSSVYAFSSSNVSEGVRQEAQAAKACAFCFK